MSAPEPTTRVLVVGSLPPPEGARSKALRTELVRLLDEGHRVEVLAPDPVATAHRYLSRFGLVGCIQLAGIVGGFDSVLVQLQPGLPVKEGASWWVRILCLRAFSFALRRGHHVVIRLEDLDDLPGGATDRAALRMWRSAEQIVVGGEELREAVATAVGQAGADLVVSFAPDPADDIDRGGWGDGASTSAETVLELVRDRAAMERREASPTAAAHFAGWERLAIPGSASTELGSTMLRSPRARRTLGDLARLVLASADRRPLLRPLVAFARFTYHRARAIVGTEKSD